MKVDSNNYMEQFDKIKKTNREKFMAFKQKRRRNDKDRGKKFRSV